MADEPDDREDHGAALLARISNEMVRAQKQFFGKGPIKAKSYMLDDLLLIVMRDGLTTAEKTMLEFGQPDQVRAFRQLFENDDDPTADRHDRTAYRPQGGHVPVADHV